jgi:CHAD domain-containing protein
MIEREIKLLPSDGESLRVDELGAIDGVHVTGDEVIDLRADYHDTSDLRLARWGITVRYRAPEGWTLKLPRGRSGEMLDRDERSFPGEPGEVPSQVRDLVLAFTRAAPLDVMAHLDTRRRELQLADEAGALIATVTDDDVRVTVHGEDAGGFRELEVELAPDASPTAANDIVRVLRRSGATSSDGVPKFVRALGARARQPAEVAPAPLHANADIATVVASTIGASVQRLLVHDPGARLGDAEAVHQARVATRRLRSDLRTMRPWLQRERVAALRAELRWLGEKLGAVRDTDVLAELLQRRMEVLPAEGHSAPTALLRRLAREHDDARHELMIVLRSDRYLALLERLVAAARRPPLRAKVGTRRARKPFRRVTRKAFRRVERAVRALPTDPEDGELHEIRKRAKRARYAAEAATPVLRKRASRLAQRLEAVQEVLGAHQDAVAAREWLHTAGLAADDGADTYVAGELAGLFLAEQREVRATWPKQWKRARVAAKRVM